MRCFVDSFQGSPRREGETWDTGGGAWLSEEHWPVWSQPLHTE